MQSSSSTVPLTDFGRQNSLGSHLDQRAGVLDVAFRLPGHDQQVKAVDGQEERQKQQQPRCHLMDSEGISELVLHVQENQTENGLDSKKAVEAVRAPVPQHRPRRKDDPRRNNDKDDDFVQGNLPQRRQPVAVYFSNSNSMTTGVLAWMLWRRPLGMW